MLAGGDRAAIALMRNVLKLESVTAVWKLEKRMALVSSPPFSLFIAATFRMLKVGLLSCFCPFFLGCWMDLTSSILLPPFF